MDQENARTFAVNFADIFPGLACIHGSTQRAAPPLPPTPPVRRTRAPAPGTREFVVDGVTVPKLNLGEAGRAELKSLISKRQKERRDLKEVCDRIAKVKAASIVELLTIARICGLWEEAERIAAKPKCSQTTAVEF